MGGLFFEWPLNTNIDVSAMTNVRFEDRIRPGQKRKGSLGTERFEVYFKDIGDMKNFAYFLSDKLWYVLISHYSNRFYL